MNIYSECFIFCQISFLKYLDLLKICSKKDSFYEYSYITFSFGFFKYIPETYQFLQRSYKILKYPPLNPHRCADATAGAVRRISLFQTTLKQNTMERQDPIKDKAAYTSLKRHRTLCALSIQSAPPNILFPHKKTGREIFPCLFEIHIGVYACTFFLSSSSCSRSSFGSLSPNFL